MAADSVLAIDDQPNARQPLVETKRRVLHHGSDLRGELAFRVSLAALPAALLLQVPDLIATAVRAHDAQGPTLLGKVFDAIVLVGEVDDCFLEGLGFVCHEPSMPESSVLVKYIYAAICLLFSIA
jgi:hypothetical protein